MYKRRRTSVPINISSSFSLAGVHNKANHPKHSHPILLQNAKLDATDHAASYDKAEAVASAVNTEAPQGRRLQHTKPKLRGSRCFKCHRPTSFPWQGRSASKLPIQVGPQGKIVAAYRQCYAAAVLTAWRAGLHRQIVCQNDTSV